MVQKQPNLIKLASPDIKQSDINKAISVIKSGNLVQGQNVALFGEKLAHFTQIDNCSVVSSATAGLHLLLKALGITQGDHLVVPAFTFPATANVVENLGANVIFCDVGKSSYVMEADNLEACIKTNKKQPLKAIIIVHEFGYPANIKAISKIAKKYNLLLIEDAACALGTVADGKHVGHYSDGAVFSFHPRKAITSGEGGAIVSKHKKIIKKIEILKNHGIERLEKGVDFTEAGLNYRMTDFQAALMLGQLDRFDKELYKRIKLAKLYYNHLEGIPFLSIPKYAKNHSYQSFMVVLDKNIDRSNLIQYLQDHNIQTNLGAQSLPALAYYKKKYSLQTKDYKEATNLYTKGLVLPLYGKLCKKDILRVCDVLRNYQ